MNSPILTPQAAEPPCVERITVETGNQDGQPSWRVLFFVRTTLLSGGKAVGFTLPRDAKPARLAELLALCTSQLCALADGRSAANEPTPGPGTAPRGPGPAA